MRFAVPICSVRQYHCKKNLKRRNKKMSELLTVSEVADILRVDDTTVRRWVKLGVLEAVVLPHLNTRQGYRIKRETLDKVLGGATTIA
jgi:excisionase family DNA binding protein